MGIGFSFCLARIGVDITDSLGNDGVVGKTGCGFDSVSGLGTTVFSSKTLTSSSAASPSFGTWRSPSCGSRTFDAVGAIADDPCSRFKTANTEARNLDRRPLGLAFKSSAST